MLEEKCLRGHFYRIIEIVAVHHHLAALMARDGNSNIIERFRSIVLFASYIKYQQAATSS